MSEDVDQLASDLRGAVGRLVRRVREDDALPPARVALLGLLDRDGPLTPTELAARRRVRQQSASKAVAQLAADGLVVARPHPDDGRKSRVELTAAGRAALDAERARRADALATAMRERLTPEERATLAEAVVLLDRLGA